MIAGNLARTFFAKVCFPSQTRNGIPLVFLTTQRILAGSGMPPTTPKIYSRPATSPSEQPEGTLENRQVQQSFQIHLTIRNMQHVSIYLPAK